jgi:hypothetical protein
VDVAVVDVLVVMTCTYIGLADTMEPFDVTREEDRRKVVSVIKRWLRRRKKPSSP